MELLGVVFVFGLLLTWAGWWRAQAEGDKSRIYLWRMHLSQVALIGALASLPDVSSWWPLAGYGFYAIITTCVSFLTMSEGTREAWLRVGRTVGLTAAGFWVPWVVFVHQPHLWWSLLTYLTVATVCTYVPFVRAKCLAVAEVFKLGYRENQRRFDTEAARKQRRAEWLARR